MFGNNEIVGRSHFSGALREGKVAVTSIFATLQGEGPFSGMRAVFIRLAKCNLACRFCDTYFDSGDLLTVDDVVTRATAETKKFYAPAETRLRGDPPIIVFTGGEPSLQMEMLEKLVQAFVDLDFMCQIESNGILPFTQAIRDNAVVVISPKCVEKDGVPVKYVKPHSINLENAWALKFVVTADDSSPYYTLPSWVDSVVYERQEACNALPVYVSPMNMYARAPTKTAVDGATLEQRSTVDETISFWEDGLLDMQANRKNHERAAQLCMETGAVLSLQSHLYASLP